MSEATSKYTGRGHLLPMVTHCPPYTYMDSRRQPAYARQLTYAPQQRPQQRPSYARHPPWCRVLQYCTQARLQPTLDICIPNVMHRMR